MIETTTIKSALMTPTASMKAVVTAIPAGSVYVIYITAMPTIIAPIAIWIIAIAITRRNDENSNREQKGISNCF